MTTGHTDYRYIFSVAERDALRQALAHVSRSGLPGQHHLYISFLTDFPGTRIPDALRQRYPGQMTIILQHRFHKLEVDGDRFGVTLSFDSVPRRLEIPMAAVTGFANPHAGLQVIFPAPAQQEAGQRHEPAAATAPELPGTTPGPEDATEATVIHLDRFRQDRDQV